MAARKDTGKRAPHPPPMARRKLDYYGDAHPSAVDQPRFVIDGSGQIGWTTASGKPRLANLAPGIRPSRP
ncbi:hypothetical protein LG047_13050 [Methylocystis sp. WRRC1]|uniref:hypothetical protein n=1 Tax=unclassified Methylocystis TaxID=2625913 RepID=UPI0001F8888B|nr:MULTISPECIES: hypothetical protein [unclassified Methylocystis]MCC3246236.1 hypothetical protein [Methylocystis sp. WRRC1]